MLEFWGTFMDLGGRTMLSLLLITIILLLILEITKYGHTKNYRNGKKISGSNKRWINGTVKRRSKFDGMEILEIDTQRISARPSMLKTQYASTEENLFITDGNGLRRIDRATMDTLHGVDGLRLDKDELSTSTNGLESFSSAFTKQQIKE